MIVDPDFLDHWKTRMLVDLLSGDECAPLYVIRLWGHCQTRRNWVFDIPNVGVKALCRFQGDASAIDGALIAAGFISRDGSSVTVIGWDEHNASLIANWKNGKKGGRPPKNKPKDKPSETHGLPMENPEATHQEPIGEDRIGLDRIGKENTGQSPDRPDDPCVTPDQVAKIYNDRLGDILPACKALTDKRRAHIRGRIKEDAKRKDADWWDRYFTFVGQSPFLVGQGQPKDNGKPFCANIEWLINPNNMTKVIEGNYHHG